MTIRKDVDIKWCEETFSPYSCEPGQKLNLTGWEIIGAILNSYAYEEDFWGLFKDPEGKLWELETCHCSCNDFSDAWAPVETNVEAMKSELAKAKQHGWVFEKYVAIEEFLNASDV
jgi:hypothetical protein